MDTLPGPSETIVSTAHGIAALSDAAHPVTIAHHSQGAVLTPPSPPRSSSSSASPESSMAASVVGKVHFPLPTLRAPEEETSHGSLTAGYAIVSTALEVAVAPYPHRDGQLALQVGSKITRAEVFAGRELLWSSHKGGDDDDDDSLTHEDQVQQQQQQEPLPAGQDFRLHIESVIYGDESNGARFNENPRGLGVTLTVQFSGERPGLMVSSVALVQMMGSRKLRS
ncbi:hypothetical protein VM1G_07812 [Cytospora mali]|uniref:Uncharacterized protein n=1 Tax=Cytospora mali TaxID=578113 RepID=A0A194W7P1_CYTMA|nr:hypothetical protein VM1G_07812 [Valsa mali]